MVVTVLGQVFLAIRSEDWKADDSVANHDCTVLDEHGVVDAHEEALSENVVNVRVELSESTIDVLSLPLGTVIEGNLLGVLEERGLERSVFSLELLLHCGKSAERRGNDLDNNSREQVPGECQGGSFPSDEVSKLSTEQEHVKDWLGEVDIESS